MAALECPPPAPKVLPMRIQVLRLPRTRALLGALVLLSAGTAAAEPASVTLVGSVQSSAACTAGDTACANSRLAFDAGDKRLAGHLQAARGHPYVPRGRGRGRGHHLRQGRRSHGEELSLTLDLPPEDEAASSSTTTPRATGSPPGYNSVIATAPGNFQSELGCPGDWQPDCLRSWLKDTDGDGIYTFTTTALPAGGYEGKVAINESWNENYGEGGAPRRLQHRLLRALRRGPW